jgi:4-amino-4-deoxy-L-arabinose transferase-like glycosyltransferase
MTAMELSPTSSERNLGLQWVAAVVAGWVIGFFLCGVIQDFVSTFLIDGLVIGSAIGIAQAIVLRRGITPAVPWVAVSIVGYGIGKFVADTVGLGMTGLAAMALGGAIIGLAVGLTQSVLLMERYPRALWWILANVLGWTVGWSLIALADSWVDSVGMAYVVGGVGAAAVGVITAVALIGLTRNPESPPSPVDQVANR